MQFKENIRLTYATKQISERIGKMHRGQIITYALLINAADIARESPQWKTLTKKIRNTCLTKFGFTLVSIPGIGYRIATAADQANDAMGRTKRAGRQLSRGVREVSATPDDLCSDHERRVKNAKLQILRGQIGF